MFSKKAFTLTELMTTVAILAVVFSWVSVSVSSFNNQSEIWWWEDIFKAKIRWEKVSAISWEVNCSKTSLFYWKNFFEIFHWIEKNFLCNKKFLSNFSLNNWKISFQTYQKPEIQIFTNWWKWWEIYPEESWNKFSFDLSDDYSYKIIAQKWDKIEESELVFFNQNPKKISEDEEILSNWKKWISVKKVSISKISWKDFKREKIFWDKLEIIFVNSNPKSKIFLRWKEINDAEISLKTFDSKDWENQKFNFFSANIFWWNQKDLNILKILKK